RTAPDLMQQTGATAIGVDAVLTGAQPKHLLQDLNGFTHPPGVGIRAKEMALPAGTAPVIGNTRRLVRADHQVGVGLVIPEKNVVAWPQTLDEVVFQQQGLGLAAGNSHLDARDTRHHMGNAGTAQRFLKVRADTTLEIPRLAHIQYLAL